MNGNNTVLSDDILISHVLAECQKILSLTGKITREEFLEDVIYQDALIREI